jgi:hypothetical protein
MQVRSSRTGDIRLTWWPIFSFSEGMNISKRLWKRSGLPLIISLSIARHGTRNVRSNQQAKTIYLQRRRENWPPPNDGDVGQKTRESEDPLLSKHQNPSTPSYVSHTVLESLCLLQLVMTGMEPPDRPHHPDVPRNPAIPQLEVSR